MKLIKFKREKTNAAVLVRHDAIMAVIDAGNGLVCLSVTGMDYELCVQGEIRPLEDLLIDVADAKLVGVWEFPDGPRKTRRV